jgi:cytosine/adenosine deaminase-related metal-dependent hydrolase
MGPLTNAHTHLELTDLAHLCPTKPTTFVSWMGRLAWNLRKRSDTQVQASIERGIAELQSCGTTHVGDITRTWLSIEPLMASGLQGVVYLEVIGYNKNKAFKRLEQAKIEIGKARRFPNYGAVQVGLSLHAPYSCHPDLLRAGAEWCRVENVPLCIHAAESPAETKFLLSGKLPFVRGPVASLVKMLLSLPASVPGLRPIPYLAQLGVLAARPLLVHAVHVTEDDIGLIANSGCAIVHCPRSNDRLSCGRMPLEHYLAAGVPVYLGTDSRASSPDLDVRAEAGFAQHLHAELVEAQKIAQLIHQPFPPTVEKFKGQI